WWPSSSTCNLSAPQNWGSCWKSAAPFPSAPAAWCFPRPRPTRGVNWSSRPRPFKKFSKPDDPGHPAVRRSRDGVLIRALSLLSALTPLAIDMALPGFQHLERDLGLAPGGGAGTVGIFLLGYALGPLWFGPLSDSLGRKPVLYAGRSEERRVGREGRRRYGE